MARMRVQETVRVGRYRPGNGEAAGACTGHKLALSSSPPYTRDRHRAVPANLLTRSPRRRAASLAASRDADQPALRRTVSPVATAAGTFTLTVIRDVTYARRARPGRSRGRQAHDGQELLDSVITSLYHVGLSLQAAADPPHDAASQGIAEALQHLDDTIRQIRDTAFTTCGPETHPAPRNDAGRRHAGACPRRPAGRSRGQIHARKKRASTGSGRPLTNTAISLICKARARRAASHSRSYRYMSRVMPGSRARYPDR